MKVLSILASLVIFTATVGFFTTSPRSGNISSNRGDPDVPDRFEASHAYQALEWQYRLRSRPVGHIPSEWREEALRRMDVMKKSSPARSPSAVSWTALGPDNIGGRVRSIAIDPTNSDVLYCGSVSGGIWKSTDAGASWHPTDDMAANLVISSIVIDPNNTNTLYAGTGEGFFNYDALRGAGVLKSTDGGSTYTLQENFAGSPGGYPYYINDLYIRSDNSSVLFAATNSGLFRTTNGGDSWGYVSKPSGTRRATEIVGDPFTPSTFYVAYGNFSTDGIYKTTDGGSSFTKLTGGFPTHGFYRISLAIAPGDPSVLYACLADTITYGTHSIMKSTDAGANWTQVATPMDASIGSTHLGPQGWYNNVIAVSPADPAVVYTGGINFFRSVDGGGTWNRMTTGYPSGGAGYMHVDQHAIVVDPANSQIIYAGNDGGVYKSTNGGSSFVKSNEGLAITQFYSGAAHPTAEAYYGGTQDNGTERTSAPPDWVEVLEGDGGATAVDFDNPTTVYTEYIYLNFLKSNNSGVNWFKAMSGLNSWGSGQSDGTADRVAFIAPFVMDPSNSLTLVAGTYRVYRTTNGATSWSTISDDLTGEGSGSTVDPGSVISALAIAESSPSTIYVGTTGWDSSARVMVTTNTGSTWNNITKAPLPNRAVTSFAVDPANASRVYAGFSGYSSLTPTTPGHVFRTTNRGLSWSNVSGDLPDVPVNAVVVDPGDPTGHLIVGTDLGIFETTNAGLTWTEQNTGMARVAVFDLDLRDDGVLIAATHGRGLFKSTASIITGIDDNEAAVPSSHRLYQNYPNPFNPSTTITFDVAARSRVRLRIYDAAGREVATLRDGMAEPGRYREEFSGGTLSSGVYYAVLEIDRNEGGAGFRDVRKMVLVK